jgi:hypothetical protein
MFREAFFFLIWIEPTERPMGLERRVQRPATWGPSWGLPRRLEATWCKGDPVITFSVNLQEEKMRKIS